MPASRAMEFSRRPSITKRPLFCRSEDFSRSFTSCLIRGFCRLLMGSFIRTNVKQYLPGLRSEEHTSELQSLMRISYAVFCLKKKNTYNDDSAHDKNIEINTD